MDNWGEWEARINRSIGQRLQGAERNVARGFAQALAEVRQMMSFLYEKYSKDGKLTYEDMAKYERLTKFMADIDSLMTVSYREVYKIVYEVLGYTYAETWDLTAWAIETDAKAKLGYGTASAETIAAMINNPVAGLTLAHTLQKNRQAIVWTIQQEVTQGLAKGDTYRTMMERLKPALDNDATKAMRIVRTEGHRVTEGAKIDAAGHANKQGVIMVKTWMSSRDQRVRHTNKADHRKLDGVTLPVDKEFQQGRGRGLCPGQMGSAAHDINCRCWLKYSIDRVEKTQYDNLEQLGFDKWRQERQA